MGNSSIDTVHYKKSQLKPIGQSKIFDRDQIMTSDKDETNVST